jgi:hypothetical protein
VFVLFSLLFRVGVWADQLLDPWMGEAPSDDRVVFQSTHSLTHFDSPPYPFISIHIHFVDVSHVCLFPSLSLFLFGVWADQLLDPWMGEAPSDDRVVFQSTHSLTHFDYVPYPFISIHIHFVDVSHVCLLPSLSLLVLGVWVVRLLDPWMGTSPI